MVFVLIDESARINQLRSKKGLPSMLMHAMPKGHTHVKL